MINRNVVIIVIILLHATLQRNNAAICMNYEGKTFGHLAEKQYLCKPNR